MTKIEFTNNYRDLSTEQGFQFELTANAAARVIAHPFNPTSSARSVVPWIPPAACLAAFSARLPRWARELAVPIGRRTTIRRSLKRRKRLKVILSSARAAPPGCAVKNAGTRAKGYVNDALPTLALRWQPRNPAALSKRSGRIPRWLRMTVKC